MSNINLLGEDNLVILFTLNDVKINTQCLLVIFPLVNITTYKKDSVKSRVVTHQHKVSRHGAQAMET